MKWTVLWNSDAADDLTNMWVNSPDKSALTAAANRIDAQLAKDPLNTGESRDADDRVHHEAPLGVLFTVDAKDRQVLVVRIWRVLER
jgi:hypothetical protein